MNDENFKVRLTSATASVDVMVDRLLLYKKLFFRLIGCTAEGSRILTTELSPATVRSVSPQYLSYLAAIKVS